MALVNETDTGNSRRKREIDATSQLINKLTEKNKNMNPFNRTSRINGNINHQKISPPHKHTPKFLITVLTVIILIRVSMRNVKKKHAWSWNMTKLNNA